MCLLFLLFLASGPAFELPVPIQTWQVGFSPNEAVVLSNGRSLLFTGSQLYVYKPDGTLRANSELAISADRVYLGPNDSVWLHDGKSLLACLNNNNNLRWQREMPPPICPPTILGDNLVYALSDQVMLLDPEDGVTRYSLRHGESITSVLVVDGWVILTDKSGQTLAWEPLTEKKEPRFVGLGEQLRYINRSPVGEWVLAYEDGRLVGLRADGKPLWHRNFHIKIPVPPLFVSTGKGHQLVVATSGRNLYTFGPNRGEQLGRSLVNGRPLALIPFSRDLVLLLPKGQTRQLWYHGPSGTFRKQKSEAPILLHASGGSFLLLMDGSGIIRLYQTKVSPAN